MGTTQRHRGSRRRSAKPPIALTRGRAWALAAVGIAWALFSPSFGAAILPPDRISGWWQDLRQSPTEEAVERYVAEVEDAAIWAQSPQIYESSVTYFEDNYDELDPEAVHAFPGIGAQEPIALGHLATEAAGWTGKVILASADVRNVRLIAPVTPEIGSYRIALADRHVSATEVVCRLPFKRTLPFTTGDRVTFTGVVLADGLAERERAEGMKRVVYMACTSMVQSVNVSIVPDRRPGRTYPRPRVEINK
jgi:hypothetical protein